MTMTRGQVATSKILPSSAIPIYRVQHDVNSISDDKYTRIIPELANEVAKKL